MAALDRELTLPAIRRSSASESRWRCPIAPGQAAYVNVYWDTPPYIRFLTAGGYTRQPYQMQDGWRSRFWVASGCCTAEILTQGAGIGTTSTFAPHLWPYGGSLWDFTRFVFELTCVRQARCDTSGFNATDLNGLVFALSDDSPSRVAFTGTGSPLMQGEWVHGTHGLGFDVADLGSGIRNEKMIVDGAQRWGWDHGAECATSWSASNGDWARTFQPCPTGSWARSVPFETGSLGDGAHSLSLCTEDFAQWQGLYGTKGETCIHRTVLTDNTAPGAPAGLVVTSANPNRYLDRFGAQFTLPPNSGSPIARVHYQVLSAAGEVVRDAQAFSAVNPTGLTGIEGPAKAGDYRLRVWLEDQAGWTGPASVAPIPRDTVPPAAPQGLP